MRSLSQRDDPEPLYFASGLLAWAGQEDDALRLLSRSVTNGYLTGEAWDLDPMLNTIRHRPSAKIRAESKRKQDEFLAFRQNHLSN